MDYDTVITSFPNYKDTHAIKKVVLTNLDNNVGAQSNLECIVDYQEGSDVVRLPAFHEFWSSNFDNEHVGEANEKGWQRTAHKRQSIHSFVPLVPEVIHQRLNFCLHFKTAVELLNFQTEQFSNKN